MKVKELVKLVEKDDWKLARTKGSHRQFKHASNAGTVTIAGTASVDVPPGTANNVLKQAGLKNQVRQMKYMVVVEKGPTSWGAYVPDLPGCVAAGDSREEVLHLIQEAVEFHLEGLKEDGQPLPAPQSSSESVEVRAA